MTAEIILRTTCDFCDTQLSIPVREALTTDEVAGQVRQHGWTYCADRHTVTHLCPLCVEVLDDAPPPSEDIPW